MAIDLKALNHNQLNELITKAQERQQELRKEKVVTLREKILEMIKSEGFSFEDIFGSKAKATRRTGGTVAPKYRNPANPEQTWTGRGKRPRWFTEALQSGKKEKDLEI
ncbi:H-NS family nucleoid-associated regulatory protein [Aerosticca soli]|uniref:DNA-binding protein n=1 Tax=Aerosticca soli TaxID=2010829 RepID=A0A2Z6E5N9_9GAMM|nr:H-NS histone family protein [Aerosticca soli]BBD80373.1 DNA-binding protein [Aerosticca soli]